jgi:hypothetical protein
MLELINQVGQQAYSTALSHGSALTDAFVSKRAEYDRGAVGASVKGALTMQELSNAPNFDHPVIKNELRQKASQLARSFPDKSPQEIASMAKQYMIDVASALSPSAPAGSKPQDGDFDWDKWLSN